MTALSDSGHPEIEFYSWADEERRKVFPKALQEPPPVGFSGWYAGAVKAAGGDARLRGAWLAWLKDEWGRGRTPPCSISAFIADRVWFKHVPGQAEVAKGPVGKWVGVEKKPGEAA